MLFSASVLFSLSPLPDHHGPHPATALHSVAEVNDPRSHGVVGDNLLSLNEAIGLFNRTLSVNQLSAAELSRLSGAGADIALARIDATAAPNITVEADFDVLMNWPHGLSIESYNGQAVIDFSGPGVTHGFRSNCDLCSWRNLEIVGGPYAIDLVQTDATFGGTVVQDVFFNGQTQFAIRVGSAPTAGGGRLVVGDCTFLNTTAGILFDETAAGRSTTFVVVDTRFLWAGTAIDCSLGSGGQSTYVFEATSIEGAVSGLRIDRPAGANRPLTLQATHFAVAANDCFVCAGAPGAPTRVELRMLDLSAGPGGTALSLGTPGSGVDGAVQDSRLSGNLAATSGQPLGLRIDNLRCAAGNLTLTSESTGRFEVSLSRFDNCAITAGGQAPVAFTECCLIGGSLQGSASAPVETSMSFCTASVGAHVTQLGPLLAPQLGSMQVAPTLPLLGGIITLSPDLPAGLLGLFVVGPRAAVTEPLPAVRAYFDFPSAQIVGIVQQQQTVTLPVPVSLALLGTEWVAQIAVVPLAALPAPALQAPPGGRFHF